METTAPAGAFPATLPAGIRARRPDLAQDADAVTALARAYNDAYVGHPTGPAGQLFADVAAFPETAGQDTWLLEDSGRIACFGYFNAHAVDPADPKVWLDVWTHPGWASQLEAAMLEALFARLGEWQRQQGHARVGVESGHNRGDSGTQKALAERLSHESWTGWGARAVGVPG